MKSFCVLLGILIFFVGCKKKTTTTTPVFYVFSGITTTDINAIPSNIDSTDWKYGDSWTSKESALFNSNFSSTCSSAYNYQISMYPNPCYASGNILLDMPSSSRFAFRIVDEKWNVLGSSDSIVASNFILNTGSIQLKDTVRMYYKFIDGSCEYRGHGDIVIK